MTETSDEPVSRTGLATATRTDDARPRLSILYEHPDWFRPLFRELERRGIPFEARRWEEHWFDPGAVGPSGVSAETRLPAVFFNRMSPSAWLRGREGTVAYTSALLAHLEAAGVRVVNGSRAWAVETSKALQISLLASLGLPFPAARVIHDAGQAPTAADALRFPVVVKPDLGGSGAGIRRFDEADTLADAAWSGELDLGATGTALVQEYAPHAEGRIVRVEVLGGRFLYAIRVYPEGDDFNLCPADACRTVDGGELTRSACPVDAPDTGMRVEGYTPPAEVVEQVERIADAAGIDVGGVEYLVDDRDGSIRFYDVNALSNFVADGPRVVGFDPFERLVDWLEALGGGAHAPPSTAAADARIPEAADARTPEAAGTDAPATPTRTET